jgi:hypothetical protein
MRNKWIITLLVVAFCGGLWAEGAQAGWFDKKQKKEKEKTARTHRYDFFPTMSYHQGVLRRDTFSGWKLNTTPMQLIKGVAVTSDGVEGVMLQEGQKVVVMGSKVGDTIVAWRVRVVEQDWNVTRDTSRDGEIEWSTEDPTVGEGPITE